MDPNALSHLLLSLYRSASATPIKDFRTLALGHIQRLLPFDGVMWTSTSLALHRPLRHVWVLGGVAPEALELFERYPDDDVALTFAAETLGEPRILQAGDAKPGLMAEFTAYSRMREVMITAQRAPDADRFTLFTVGRRDGPPFSDADRDFMRTLMPHLDPLVLQNFEFQTMSTMVHRIAGEVGLAVAADDAVILREAHFTQLLWKVWPNWSGTMLPDPLLQALRTGKSFVSYGGAGFYFVAGDGHVLIIATPASALHRLTNKEYSIASDFAHGKSYKEVARDHGLSPDTVRSRLRSVYDKLSVNDKTELSRRFSQTQLLEDLQKLL